MMRYYRNIFCGSTAVLANTGSVDGKVEGRDIIHYSGIFDSDVLSSYKLTPIRTQTHNWWVYASPQTTSMVQWSVCVHERSHGSTSNGDIGLKNNYMYIYS